MEESVSMRYLRPELKETYTRMANQAPVVIGVSSVDITVDDVLCAYIILADYFTDPSLPENVEQMLIGIRDYGLLASAVSRQIVAFGKKLKYTQPLDVCATLFYGLVKDHAFLDGNKRVALLILLYHLSKHGYVPSAKIGDFESLVVAVAANTLPKQYGRLWDKTPKDMPESDRCVQTISSVLKVKTKKKDNSFHVDITGRELRSILAQYGVTSEVNDGRVKFERRIVTGRWLKHSDTLVVSIPYRGDTRTIGAKGVRYVLSKLSLYDQFPSYADIIQGSDPRYMLIERFEGPLRRLKDK